MLRFLRSVVIYQLPVIILSIVSVLLSVYTKYSLYNIVMCLSTISVSSALYFLWPKDKRSNHLHKKDDDGHSHACGCGKDMYIAMILCYLTFETVLYLITMFIYFYGPSFPEHVWF